MRQNARQHLEEQLRRLAQQWDGTKQKLRALARQTRQEQRYRYGDLVENVAMSSGTLSRCVGVSGICECSCSGIPRSR
jgi:hypothetical protein